MTAIKFLRMTSLVILIALALPANSTSLDPGSPQNNSTEKAEDLRAQQMVHRLEEIKGMSKSELTRSERKSLRKEVKEIRKEKKENRRGVFLSVGAIIIIVVLVLILVL